MADPQGFSATKFIKKQYNKDSQPSTDNPILTPEEMKKAPEVISLDAIKAIVNQYLESAEKHNNEGRFWESIGMYNAALHLAPQDLNILQSLANCYVKTNARIKAVETFTRIAGVYERQGQVEKVNEIYEKIYGIDPTNKLACSVLGRKPGQDAPSLDMYSSPAVEEIPQTGVQEPVELKTDNIVQELETRDERQETRDPVPILPVSEFQKTSEDDIPTVIRRDPPTPEQMEGPKAVEEVIPLEKLSITPPVAKPTEPIIKVIDTAGPKPVEEIIPFDNLKVATPVEKHPEPVKEKVIDTAGPKPVEEMIPFDNLTATPAPAKPLVSIQEKVVEIVEPKAVEELIPFENLKAPTVPTKSFVPAQEKIIEKVEPKPVEELIPFPPMPEKKVEVSVVSTSQSVETPVVKEEFPLPLPELKVVERKPIEMPMPEKKADVIVSTTEPQISPLASPNEHMQYCLDTLAMDPDNIEARLNYINAFLEIGMEAELVDDYLELANCYLDQGNQDEAVKYYQKVLELEPNIEIAKRRLAQCKGESQPVVPTQVQETPEQSVIPQETVATSNLDDKEQAQINQFHRLMQINPINEPIARKLANIYINKNMKKEAVAEMVSLADAYMQKGMYNKAVPVYEEAFKEDPTAELKEKLAKAHSLHKSMDAINQAIKSYKTELKV